MKLTNEEEQVIYALSVENKVTRSEIILSLVRMGIQHLKENIPELQDK